MEPAISPGLNNPSKENVKAQFITIGSFSKKSTGQINQLYVGAQTPQFGQQQRPRFNESTPITALSNMPLGTTPQLIFGSGNLFGTPSFASSFPFTPTSFATPQATSGIFTNSLINQDEHSATNKVQQYQPVSYQLVQYPDNQQDPTSQLAQSQDELAVLKLVSSDIYQENQKQEDRQDITHEIEHSENDNQDQIKNDTISTPQLLRMGRMMDMWVGSGTSFGISPSFMQNSSIFDEFSLPLTASAQFTGTRGGAERRRGRSGLDDHSNVFENESDMDTILNTKDASNDYKQDDQINNIKFSDRSTTIFSTSWSIIQNNFNKIIQFWIN
ncbi:MAG: hypothetical protein EZS28_016450 [Streblomastix strix]|uniref:Uncharacterized protein n=1 Tax=Streblomastix strix TaxID=222440 RepID=A0A5J4VZC0_9EUKA|nr:MAG: hypothetical protein EZS28_016450 [Streblomastix strix]